MFRVEIRMNDQGNVEGLVQAIGRDFFPDWTVLEEGIQLLAREAVADLSRNQQDRYGDRMPDIKESTQKRRRYANRGRPPKGGGPAMAPGGDASTRVAGVQISGKRAGKTYTLTIDYPNAPYFIHHTKPYRTRPERDILGIDAFLDEITNYVADELVQQYLDPDRHVRPARPGTLRSR